MERLYEYLRRNITIAVKGVFYNFNQYAVFFAAVFLIQTLFGIITAASDNDNILEYKYVSDEYDYHVALTDLNEAQRLTLVNDTQTVFSDEYIFDIVREVPRDEEGSYNRKYDIYVSLHDDIYSNYLLFQYRYFEEMAAQNEEGLHVSTSPLMHFDRNLKANRAYYLIFAAVLTVVSVFFMMSLYFVRLNHYSFTYGIYMTYGADFKKMFGTAFWEMTVISVCTFMPSCIVSALIDLIIYKTGGESFSWRITGSLKVLLFSFLITSLSVILPIWVLSRWEPMKNLIAEDNSNLVISPRQSFDLSRVSFPLGYGMRSLWRFRKYQLRQVVTSVLFIALFMSVMYYSDVCRRQLDYELPQFTVSFANSAYKYTDDERDDLLDIDGITMLSKDRSVQAVDISSHVVFDRSDIRPFTQYAVTGGSGKEAATNFISYHACDEDVVQNLGFYSYKGDLTKVLEDGNYVIVSDSYDNSKKFNIRPGDTIKIAKFKKQRMLISGAFSGITLLNKQLECFDFDYTEYTVCAVLENNPCFGSSPIYLNIDNFENLTDTEAVFDSVDIYIDKESDISEVNRIGEEIREWTEFYPDISLSDTHNASEYRIEKAKQKPAVYSVCAVIILLFAPLIQMFTQTLYYSKRENEFSILGAFGAISSELRGIFRNDGYFSAAVGVIISQILNIAAVYAVFYYANVLVPKFGGIDVRYPFGISAVVLIIGILVAAISGTLSSLIPYNEYIKRARKSEEAEEFKAETDH